MRHRGPPWECTCDDCDRWVDLTREDFQWCRGCDRLMCDPCEIAHQTDRRRCARVKALPLVDLNEDGTPIIYDVIGDEGEIRG